MKLFCAGLGAATPDVADASRRMKLSEFQGMPGEQGDRHHRDPVGLDGIAFAAAKGSVPMNLTPEIIYRALAANPYGKPQTARTWHDVDPSLPADAILVYGPPSTSARAMR